MSQVKNRFSFPLLIFSLVLFLLPFERMYDRFFRKFLYAHTYLPKVIIKQLYIFPSDLLILLGFIFFFLAKKVSLKKLGFEGSNKYGLFFLCTFLIPLCFYAAETDLAIWVRFFYFSLTILLFNWILTAFRSHEVPPFLILVSWLFLLIGTFETVIAYIQYFTQSGVGLSIIGEPKLNSPNMIRAEFFSQEGTGKWLIDTLFFHAPSAEVFRAYGTFPSPNLLGGFYIGYLFALWALWFHYSSKKAHFFLGLLIAFETFGLFLTYSRAGIFAYGLLVLFAFGYFLLSGKISYCKSLFKVACLSIGLSFVLLLPQIITRGGIINYPEGVQESDRGRLFAQDYAWKMIKKRPWFGTGYGRYSQECAKELPANLKHIKPMVHNIYFLIAVESGLVGLGLFLGLCFLAIYRAFQKRENPVIFCFLLFFLGFLMVGFCDYYLFFFQQGRLLFFSLAALLISSSYAERIFIFSSTKAPIQNEG